MSAQRRYLFLQGMASQFFAKAGKALAERGHTVHRINFNGGDWLFWRHAGAVHYRLGLNAWPEFLERHLSQWEITDIILFGDCRPLHREAVRIAKLRGLRVYVFDEGYLRPNWITMELGGVNGFSSLPRDPTWYKAAASKLPAWKEGSRVTGSFARRAFEDVAYNVAALLLCLLYPGYRTHRPWHPLIEYVGWLSRFARASRVKRRTRLGAHRLESLNQPYFFFPLQLDCDSQIRHHSSFGRLAPAIHHVIASFARYAPKDHLLVVKEHPLDNALTNWRKMTARIASRYDVGERLIYLEDANLDRLLQGCAGVVTVNSTVGFLALSYGRPTITLGNAIYDIPSLTYQGLLDDFWTAEAVPDEEIFDAFRRVAVSRTQINGGFFSQEGLTRAIAGMLSRLEQPIPETVVTPLPQPVAGRIPGQAHIRKTRMGNH